MKSLNDLTVIIVTFNTPKKVIFDCLNSISKDVNKPYWISNRNPISAGQKSLMQGKATSFAQHLFEQWLVMSTSKMRIMPQK